MSVLAVGSVRSCGVTTLGAALAATWPAERRVLLAELDPAGGTLAAGARWLAEPSLVTLAAAARRDTAPGQVWGHCQALPGGPPVLAGPASADQAVAAWSVLSGLLGRVGELGCDVIADCGRLGPGSPALGVLAAADRVVLAVRPRLPDLHALTAWLEGGLAPRYRASVVLIGDGPYGESEVADALGVDVLGSVPWDPSTAEVLASVSVSARSVSRSPLVRSARTLADRLAGLCAEGVPEPETVRAGAGSVDAGPSVEGPWWPPVRVWEPGPAPTNGWRNGQVNGSPGGWPGAGREGVER